MINNIKDNFNLMVNNKVVINLLNIVSGAIILWTLLLTLNALYIVCYYTIVDKIYDMNDLIYLQHKIARVHSALLMAPIIVGLISLFMKKIKISYIALALFLSFNLEVYQFFDNVIHPFLFSMHIYDFLLRPGQYILNPQFTKIFFYIIIISVLLFECLVKKYRSVDRIFITLILSVALLTTCIFHFAIPMGMFKIAKKDLEISLIEKTIFLNKKILCKDKQCFTLSNDLNVLSRSSSAHIDTFKNYSFFLPKAKQIMENENKKYYSISLGDFKGQGFDYMIVVLEKTDTGFFLIFDDTVAKRVARHSEIWFSFLSTMAHLCWFYGGFLLLFLHKMIIFRKLSPRLNKN